MKKIIHFIHNKKSPKGFTLIELLVIITIIVILVAVVIVALNPVKIFADSRNSSRWTDVNSIMTAVYQYSVDNDGTLPTGLTTGMSATEIGTCGTCANLTTPLATYLKTLPLDPSDGTTANTSYYVDVDANNIVTIEALSAENSVEVKVSR